MLRTFRCAVMLLLVASLCASASAESKLKALIVDGQNNHNWKATTPPLKALLEETGRFTVDVATTSPRRRREART
jgi:hypothetical protein